MKITHNEARDRLQHHLRGLEYIFKKEIPWEHLEAFNNYITQQEKKDELLKLYKSVHGVVQPWDTMPDVQDKIDKLEKELEELEWNKLKQENNMSVL